MLQTASVAQLTKYLRFSPYEHLLGASISPSAPAKTKCYWEIFWKTILKKNNEEVGTLCSREEFRIPYIHKILSRMGHHFRLSENWIMVINLMKCRCYEVQWVCLYLYCMSGAPGKSNVDYSPQWIPLVHQTYHSIWCVYFYPLDTTPLYPLSASMYWPIAQIQCDYIIILTNIIGKGTLEHCVIDVRLCGIGVALSTDTEIG